MASEIDIYHAANELIKKHGEDALIKAGDHIFIAIAMVNNYPLITSDAKMIDVSKECGIRVFKPAEFLDELP